VGSICIDGLYVFLYLSLYVFSQDVQLCVKSLPNVVLNYRVRDKSFNHMDFLFSEEAHKDAYKMVLSVLKRY